MAEAALPGMGPIAVVVAQIDEAVEPSAAGGLSDTGAETLSRAGEMIRRSLRADDLVGRVDGRIVMILANATADDARAVGDRLCATVRSHQAPPGGSTLSIGAAAAPDHGHSYESVLAAAMSALSRIQSQGRDGAASMPPPHHEPLHRPLSIDRFAGRAQELRSLAQWLDEASAGQPRLVSVFGDVGTGTATLLRQLESEVRLRGGMFALVASPRRPVQKPYGVWRSLLRATHVFQSTSRHWAELPYLEPALGEAPDAPKTGSQYRLLNELTDYVRSLAATHEGPLVLVLDEMQWADTTSWDALEHLVSQLDRDRILICTTHRTNGAPESGSPRRLAARPELARELTIASLTRDEVKQWLDAAFHRQPVGRELLAFLYRNTEGNPLFIAQFLRSLVEDGSIWHNRTRWEWTPVSELRIPSSRAGLIVHRLERFSASTHAVLSTAAIAGREFDVRLLVGAGAGSEAAVRLALSEAMGAGFVRPTRDRKRGNFAFTHDEVADALIDGLPKAQRKQFHLRLAQALERLRPDAADDIALR